MIKITVLYPNKAGSHFDMSYYLAKHIPLLRELMGPALLNVSVEEGLAGLAPGAPASFLVLCHLSFESAGAFQAVFTPHAAKIVGDVPNYTNSEPVIQISNVKL
jgi:uncharacterized protein (TIGR02118 family)